jgi:hypothetical protein
MTLTARIFRVTNLTPGSECNPMRSAAAGEIAVIFDFDGTLGDTESPAMEVAFWELAPYFPNVVGLHSR